MIVVKYIYLTTFLKLFTIEFRKDAISYVFYIELATNYLDFCILENSKSKFQKRLEIPASIELLFSPSSALFEIKFLTFDSVCNQTITYY